jgi:hypothetical protein
MRMREYWSIVHNRNQHRQHRQCMVCVIRVPPGAHPSTVALADLLALDFAVAAAKGELKPHRLMITNRKRVAHV